TGRSSSSPPANRATCSRLGTRAWPSAGRRWSTSRSRRSGRRFARRTVSFFAHELAHQRRFARVEAFGVERLVELVELVVEMVADLVQQGAKEGAELDHVLLLRGAHPHGDARGAARHFVGLVEALQLI